MENTTKTLCNMAWDYPMFHMFTNSFTYCCRTPKNKINNEELELMQEDYFSNHPKFIERRKALLNGQKHSDCYTCWKLEDAGFKSSRSDNQFVKFMAKNSPIIKENITLPYEQYKDIPNLEKSNYSNCIEIVLNNTCDAKCTYCSEFYSTQWLTEKKKYKEVSLSYVSQDQRNHKAEELFWSWYEKKAIFTNRRFGFIGGEPFIIEELYECMDKLIEIHSRIQSNITDVNDPLNIDDKPELCITSNLNTPPAYFEKFLNYIPKLEKFFKIIVQVSGENIGKDLEYIRHGIKFDRWSKNIEYLLEHTSVTLAFLPCLNLLSIPRFHLYLEYFYNLCERYRFMDIHHNIVTWPIEQSPTIAPKNFAVYFDQCIQIVAKLILKAPDNLHKHCYAIFLDWLISVKNSIAENQDERDPTENSKKFHFFIKKLDHRRNTNMLEIFPEFETFYKAGC